MHATTIGPFDTSVSEGERYGAIRPLLETTLAQTNAQGIYVYRFGAGDPDPSLVLWSGLSPWSKSTPAEKGVAREHVGRTAPIVVHEGAWGDGRFQRLPEFRKNRFEGIASIPLIEAGSSIGMANIGRLRSHTWKPTEVAFLLSLSLPLGTLLSAADANDSLQKQVEELSRQLADRRLFDRAKGLLQARHGWTEEHAYLHIRRASRQRRVPMRAVAIEVIENDGLAVEEELRHAG